jgi:hypothetical protein
MFVYDALGKVLIDVFLVVGLGFPAALSVTTKGQFFLPRLLLTSAIFSNAAIYLIIFLWTHFAPLEDTEFRILLVITFVSPFILKRTRGNIQALRDFSLPRFTTFEVAVMSAILLFIIITLFTAVVSSAVLDDPFAVWLYLGKQIYATGRIPLYFGNAADISWSGNYPPSASFLSAGIFFLLNAANSFEYGMVQWIYGVLCVVCIFVIVRELGGTRSSALVATLAALLTSIFSMQMLGWGYTDLIETFFVTAFLAFTLMEPGRSRTNGVLGALAFSEALLSKYDVILFLIPSVLLFLYLRRDVLRVCRSSLPQIISLTAVGFFGLSWYVRNWVELGDPVYPYLYNFFGARGIDARIISLVPNPSFQILDLIQDQTFSALTNSGDMWPIIVFGTAGVILLLFGLRLDKRVTAFCLWSTASFIALLAFLVLRGGFERYFIILVPSLAVIVGLLFDRMDTDLASITRGLSLHMEVRRAFRVAFLCSLLLVSIGTIGFLTTSSIQSPPPSAYIQTWNYLNSLPHGNVATNDIDLFLIQQPVVQFYNMPGLFNATTLSQTWSTLKKYNVSYIYFNPRFDANVFETHTMLFGLFNDTAYTSLVYSSSLNVSNGLQVYRVR